MNLIPVRSFDNYIEANILLGKLQNEGIPCFLRDEFTVTIDPILTNALGGIKLEVPEDHIWQARKLLEQFDRERKEQLVCPSCGSHEVEYISNPAKSGNWISNIISYLFSGYSVSIKKTYHCFHCGKDFDDLTR